MPSDRQTEIQPASAKCAGCGVPLNDGEAKCFTVCDAGWKKAYRGQDARLDVARARVKAATGCADIDDDVAIAFLGLFEERDTLAAELSRVQIEHEVTALKLAAAEQSHEAAGQKVIEMAARLSRVQQERDGVRDRLACVEIERDTLQRERDEANTSRLTSDLNTRSLLKEVDKRDRENAELRADRDALQQEIATLRQRIGDLADMFSEWAQHMRQVREGLRPTDHDMKLFYDSVIVGADRASSRVRAIIQKGQ